jgi:hypothetical protein
MFVFNRDRELVWEGFNRFLNQIGPIAEIDVLYIDGGFVTNNDKPKDIDIVLEFPDVPTLFGVLSHNPSLLDHDGIKFTFQVDLWFAAIGQPSHMPDLRLFFQYLRPEDAVTRNLPAGSKKGILRIALRA